MKIVLYAFLLFNTLIANGQIFTQNSANGAIVITPKGLQGSDNSAMGTTNVAVGSYALNINLTGWSNTAIGYQALLFNTSGQNTAIGSHTGHAINKGYNNTFLGDSANATGDFYNSTAIGAQARVDASNKVRIGDWRVNVIEGQVAWSNPSDRRLKENIIYTTRLGLDFINRLLPVSYNYKSDKNKIRYDGFIAQDVEQVMKELGVPFSGLKSLMLVHIHWHTLIL